ncbi:MAG: flagellar hook-basal body complex protein FliE [Myxococcales bacterium]|nr:flagellar hook-basal body complex protein FliE [Myxococcales bacterium]
MALDVQMPISPPVGPVRSEVLVPEPAPGSGEAFSDLLGRALRAVDGELKQGDAAAADFVLGKTGIHEMALALEKADLSLRLLTHVRNRIIEAYREISRMNV